MKKNLFVLAALLGTSLAFGQTSLKPFNAVSLHGCMKVEMVQGAQESFTIEGDSYETSQVKVEVSKGELSIKKSWKNDVWDKQGCNCEKVRIRLTFRSVEGIKTGWGAQVNVVSALKENALKIDASSGSEISLESQTNHLDLIASSGAVVKISGKSQSMFVKSTTGGEISAYNLDCQDVEAKANTGGSARITAQTSIEASAGTGGEIRFKGRPKQRNFSRSLGGEINSY